MLDPFLVGGTTVAVANKMGRKWIGIDQSASAIRVSEARLCSQNLFYEFEVITPKHDYQSLFTMNPFEFENWIIQQFGGVPNEKQHSDKGIDGRRANIPVQVKQSEGIGRNIIDNLKSAAERFDKVKFDEHVAAGVPVAYLIAFSFSKGAIQEVARLRLEQGIIIELIKVEDIVSVGHAPEVRLNVNQRGNEVSFTTEVKSDSEIASYAWDWITTVFTSRKYQ